MRKTKSNLLRKHCARGLVILLAALLMPAAAAQYGVEITPAPGQVNPYKTRSELLMDASKHTGVFTPEQAAELWAMGLQARSAAMQYTVMTQKLKDEYAGQLDALRSNWVTGVSSPWVQSYSVIRNSRPDPGHAEICLSFELLSSHSPSEFHNARLWLVREEGFWRVERIKTDEALYPYTLYRP